jgi:hypothetical protein
MFFTLKIYVAHVLRPGKSYAQSTSFVRKKIQSNWKSNVYTKITNSDIKRYYFKKVTMYTQVDMIN